MTDYNSIVNSIKDFLLDETKEIAIPAKYKKGKEEITEHTSLRTEIQLDSLDMYQIGYDMEKLFQISVPDEKIAEIDSVGDLAHLIEKHLKK